MSVQPILEIRKPRHGEVVGWLRSMGGVNTAGVSISPVTTRQKHLASLETYPGWHGCVQPEPGQQAPLPCPYLLTALLGTLQPHHVPCSVGTQPQQHFDGKIYEESNYCCWEGIKTIFHSRRPRATSAGATLGAPCTSQPSLWPTTRAQITAAILC